MVRYIYEQFLKGYTPESIARDLNDRNVPGWSGKANWYPSSILKMLQNEKYKGDALLQKNLHCGFSNQETNGK